MIWCICLFQMPNLAFWLAYDKYHIIFGVAIEVKIDTKNSIWCVHRRSGIYIGNALTQVPENMKNKFLTAHF